MRRLFFQITKGYLVHFRRNVLAPFLVYLCVLAFVPFTIAGDITVAADGESDHVIGYAGKPDQKGAPKRIASSAGQSEASSYKEPVPTPTFSDIPYGPHKKQVLDFWQASSASADQPAPLVYYIHGGAWQHGSRQNINGCVDVAACLEAGISVVAVEYRFIKEAKTEGIAPPVKAPLSDVARALQFVRSQAGEWHIDKQRIAATGGSAGGCSSLWLAYHDDMADPDSDDPIARESTRLLCAAVRIPQSTLDPKQINQWLGHIPYGGHAFGVSNQDFLKQRQKLLPWIKEYSPYAHVSADDPPVVAYYAKRFEKDLKAHSPQYGFHLAKRCKELGISCEIRGLENTPMENVRELTAHLIGKLTAPVVDPDIATDQKKTANQPNVLFIAIDDLNHWVGHLGRNPQAKTPNIDRLAAMGTSFTNAHCAVPSCEPSRCAIMGGRRPWTSGCYLNGHQWQEIQPVGQGLSAQFLQAGYYVAGSGKIYHSMKYFPGEWSEYMPKEGLSNNGPRVQSYDGYLVDKKHPQLKDQDIIDWHSVDYCIERINGSKGDADKPFFLACGLYKPHLAFVAPRKYYADFPLNSIKLPPHRKDDLKDIPNAGVRMANPGGDHRKFLKSGRWKAAIQSYLATIAYTDMNVGRLLDALDSSPKKDNTIIVLWSDHGWSLGEKQHWRKFALWEETTRTPYIWVVPGLTKAGTRSSRAVDLMSLYPTLCELADIERPKHVEGHSIVPLLKDPNHPWEHPAISTHGKGNHAVRTETHRYIRYANGDEELYHNQDDPYEWTNLAKDKKYDQLKQQLARHLPREEVEAAIKK